MDSVDSSKAVEITDGVYWVGYNEGDSGLRCNPYLIVEDDEAMLIEPGSVPHFPYVYKKVKEVVDPKKINRILATHQDPDLCASIPIFKNKIQNPDLTIITHTRASVLITHYGAELPYYLVDQNHWRYEMSSGRALRFIFTPYLHFPGSFVSYDEQTKTLFSGDLFGAFTFEWNLYAGEGYVEALKAFHENYMPSNDILSHSMKKLEKLDIERIAPQHGSVIPRPMVAEVITCLKELECGDYLFEDESG